MNPPSGNPGSYSVNVDFYISFDTIFKKKIKWKIPNPNPNFSVSIWEEHIYNFKECSILD